MRTLLRTLRPMSLALVFLGPALGWPAGEAAAVDFNRTYQYVSKVNVGEDGYLYINVLGNFSTSHGCSKPYYVRSKELLSDESTKAYLQMAMASFLSQASVNVWTSGCTAYGYPVLIQLQLQQ